MNKEKLYEIMNDFVDIEFGINAIISTMEILEEHYESKNQLELQYNMAVVNMLLGSLQRDLHRKIIEFDSILIKSDK